MNYIDFHAHHPAPEGCFALQQQVLTQGVHPWSATMEDLSFVPDEGIWAIGECGMDKLCSTPMETQRAVFLHQIALSEERNLPMVIHCVKALDEIVALRRETNAKQPWIMHGFRGKPQQLQTLLNANFYVSFGWHYNEDSIALCPLEKMLLETDDEDTANIANLYRKVAERLGLSEKKLLAQMHVNAYTLFKSFGE